jgi:tetratricopeptide (TPR) repeat protein
LLVGIPTADAIGVGVYDYLRHFPDCPHNVAYAELLRDAFPHYLADLAAQAVMLDYKKVDAPYVQRKVTCMKIFTLLDPENPMLAQHLGIACYELGLMFSELPRSRYHLLAAMGYLQRSLALHAANIASLNLLGEIDFLFGDYPAALRRWQLVVAALEGETQVALAGKIARIEGEEVPDHPLVDDLEAIGHAMELYGEGDVRAAGMILERLEEDGCVPVEFPSPEFYCLLGLCRELQGDLGGAFAAFDAAMTLDPEHVAALEGKNRISDGSVV